MRLYRALLRLYPRSFRAEYGEEMTAIFTRRRRAASGFVAVAQVWLEAVTDTLSNASRLHGEQFSQDGHSAVRTLLGAPGFTVTAVLVAALGIGATTAVFSVTDHVLIRPLPYPQSHRLVRLWQDQTFRGYPRMELSPANYLDWKRLATSFERMAAYTIRAANLVGQGDPERLEGALVTPDVFHVLRAHAVLGRVLTSADDLESASSAIVLSYGLWSAKFGGDPQVLGRSVVLDDTAHVVVGVMPREFSFPTRTVEFWTPLRFPPDALEDRSDTFLNVVARLGEGVTLDEARSEMAVIAAQLERAFPAQNARTGATVHRLRDQVSAETRTLLIALVAAAACMLLIACTNLANLLLARGLARHRELTVRAAVGAGWERLTRQLLTESLVLAALGGVVGVLLAAGATPLISRLVPTTMPIADVPDIDLRMLGLAAGVTLCAGLAFGMIPAWRVTRGIDLAGLREGTRAGSGPATERLRSMLVVAEVAASIVLLVSAGLLVQALWRVQQIDPGFRSENVLTMRTALPLPKYAITEDRQQFYDRVLDAVRALPGVSNAAYISFLPMVMGGGIWPVVLNPAGLSEQARNSWAPDPTETRTASLRFITPGFFDTLGIPVLRGRDVSDADTNDSAFVAVVSESFARQHWPGQDPIGQRFFMAFRERSVIGVVGTIKVRDLERDSEPQVYIPSRQVPDGGLVFYAPKDLAIRASVPVAGLAPAVRQIIAQTDPQQPVSAVRLLSEIVEDQTASRQAQVRVLGAFSMLALLLAGVGIHGLLSFTVSCRTPEIGVRMALGAGSGEIVGMVLCRGLTMMGVGTVVGLALAAAAGRALESVLAGVEPADPLVFAAAAGLAGVTTVSGCLLPAVRAARVDPVVVMRG